MIDLSKSKVLKTEEETIGENVYKRMFTLINTANIKNQKGILFFKNNKCISLIYVV